MPNKTAREVIVDGIDKYEATYPKCMWRHMACLNKVLQELQRNDLNSDDNIDLAMFMVKKWWQEV